LFIILTRLTNLHSDVYRTAAHQWSHYDTGYLQNPVSFRKGSCVTLN